MVQQVKEPESRPDGLNSVPETHMSGGESPARCLLASMHEQWRGDTYGIKSCFFNVIIL